MAIKFNQVVRHDRVQFMPGVAVAFEDARAEPYFTTLGWAEATTDAPVYTYTADEVAIDPETRVAATGAIVLPAQEA